MGKNGTGKTNFSEFLNYNLAHATNGGLSTFMKGEGIIVVGNNIFFQEEIVIENIKDLKKRGYTVKSFKNAPLDEPDGEVRWHEMEVNKYVYYNPVFDFRALQMSNYSNNICNISTNYLVNNDRNLSLKHYNLAQTSFDRNQNTDFLSAHYRNEKIREADLILNYPKIKEYISNLPSELQFTLDVTKENKQLVLEYYSQEELAKESGKIEKNRMYEELRSLMRFLSDTSRFTNFQDKDDPNLFKVPVELKKEAFQGLFWVNFFTVLMKRDSIVFPQDFFRRFIFDEKYSIQEANLAKDLEELKGHFKSFIKNCQWYEGSISIRDYYSGYDPDNSLKLFKDAYYSLSTDEDKQVILNLITKTTSILENEAPFHYQFSYPFSSGEQNLVNFYSRFYWAKNEIVKKEKSEYGVDGERIIIFIDEGEVSYHPEWQRRFFNLAISFLADLFKDKELQLIFTTHSPFVLSDIPKDNIIFLDKDESNKTEVKNYGRDETFGANIYSLLSDSFFMAGTMGEFASNQIKWVIKELEKGIENIPEHSIEKIDFIIDSVGEPIIKMQLEKLRHESQNLTEVNQLRKRIEELENRIEKGDNDSANQG